MVRKENMVMPSPSLRGLPLEETPPMRAGTRPVTPVRRTPTRFTLPELTTSSEPMSMVSEETSPQYDLLQPEQALTCSDGLALVLTTWQRQIGKQRLVIMHAPPSAPRFEFRFEAFDTPLQTFGSIITLQGTAALDRMVTPQTMNRLLEIARNYRLSRSRFETWPLQARIDVVDTFLRDTNLPEGMRGVLAAGMAAFQIRLNQGRERTYFFALTLYDRPRVPSQRARWQLQLRNQDPLSRETTAQLICSVLRAAKADVAATLIEVASGRLNLRF